MRQGFEEFEGKLDTSTISSRSNSSIVFTKEDYLEAVREDLIYIP